MPSSPYQGNTAELVVRTVRMSLCSSLEEQSELCDSRSILLQASLQQVSMKAVLIAFKWTETGTMTLPNATEIQAFAQKY